MNNRISFFLTELKYRFIYVFFSFAICFCVCFINLPILFFFFFKPLLSSNSFFNWEFFYANPLELFVNSCFVSFIISFFFCIFFFISNAVFFLVNSCTKQEFFSFFILIAFSYLSFIICFFICFNYILPNIWKFISFFEINDSFISYVFLPSIQSYIRLCFVVYIILVFCFQIPFFFICFTHSFISLGFIFNSRKVYYFLFFLISTFFSPPDVFTQVIVGIILCFIFEVAHFFYLVKSFLV